MNEKTQAYGYRAELPAPFEEAVARVREELGAEGFGVLTEIDVRETLKKKLDAEFRRYVILGACNPQLAYRALQEELEIGLLLPCNVVVYETEQGSTVSIVDPVMMLGVVENPSLEPIAEEAREKLRRVMASLSG